MAGYSDIYLDQGADFNSTIRLADDNTGANINIAGYTFSSKIRKGPLTSTTAGQFNITALDTANGTILIAMTAANTANIETGRYLYDIFQTNSSNVKSKVIEGTLMVSAGISI